VANVIEVGYELDALAGRDRVRWWVFLEISGGRYQPARHGVVDRGWRFARGGRADTPEQANEMIELARRDAQDEYVRWTHQPSHALGPDGSLIPLDDVPLELAR
jgi:hypothetical protein